MKRTPEQQEAANRAIHAAQESLAAGHFREARHHLSEAENLRADSQTLRRLRNGIKQAESAQTGHRRRNVWIGFGLGCIGYLILSLRQPLGWTIPVWALLAFLVVPICIGLTVGRGMGYDAGPGPRFRGWFRACSLVMFLYTAFNLMIVRYNIGSGDTGQVFLVGLFVSVIYALLAGLVAGLASGWLAYRNRKEETSEPAS